MRVFCPGDLVRLKLNSYSIIMWNAPAPEPMSSKKTGHFRNAETATIIAVSPSGFELYVVTSSLCFGWIYADEVRHHDDLKPLESLSQG